MHDHGLETALEFNVNSMGKSAAHYAEQEKIKHVCFFDWHSLVMFEFPDDESGGSGALPRCHVFTEDVQGKQGDATIRKFLLGFLCRAYNNMLGVSSSISAIAAHGEPAA